MFENKTQIIIRNTDEAEALMYATGYGDRGDYDIYDGNGHLLKAVRRVYDTLITELKDRGYKVEKNEILNSSY